LFAIATPIDAAKALHHALPRHEVAHRVIRIQVHANFGNKPWPH